ncbi:hypothetical protein PVL29_004771 [Vitis rotundifolia]|uniref:protein disulfide-isomerase n=1 Tax=Vitis rotundifolia TaxID=103349 RepID=A0AA39E0U4_VITRO|nr:hypothetical protein PVL29_004771 [Vitis rotundifolia]
MATRASICLFVLAFAFSILASSPVKILAAEDEAREFILTLVHSNFSDIVSKHDFIVVEFYAPWCGHCKKLAPEYEKAASILNSHDPPDILAKVDANDEANKELASEFKIRGKSIEEYKGPREADGIVMYLKKQSGPASAEIKSAEDASSLIFSGEGFENFTVVAGKFHLNYDFVHTSDAKFLPREESSVTGPLIMAGGGQLARWGNPYTTRIIKKEATTSSLHRTTKIPLQFFDNIKIPAAHHEFSVDFVNLNFIPYLNSGFRDMFFQKRGVIFFKEESFWRLLEPSTLSHWWEECGRHHPESLPNQASELPSIVKLPLKAIKLPFFESCLQRLLKLPSLKHLNLAS